MLQMVAVGRRVKAAFKTEQSLQSHQVVWLGIPLTRSSAGQAPWCRAWWKSSWGCVRSVCGRLGRLHGDIVGREGGRPRDSLHSIQSEMWILRMGAMLWHFAVHIWLCWSFWKLFLGVLRGARMEVEVLQDGEHKVVRQLFCMALVIDKV